MTGNKSKKRPRARFGSLNNNMTEQEKDIVRKIAARIQSAIDELKGGWMFWDDVLFGVECPDGWSYAIDCDVDGWDRGWYMRTVYRQDGEEWVPVADVGANSCVFRDETMP